MFSNVPTFLFYPQGDSLTLIDLDAHKKNVAVVEIISLHLVFEMCIFDEIMQISLIGYIETE